MKPQQSTGWKMCVRGVLLLSLGALSACNWGSIGYNKGYTPEQPIAYSHELHAGTYKIPCLYCHTNATKSNQATVPSMNICMNCHLTVGTQLPGVQALTEAYGKGEAIPWVKVNMLPDFVKFNHKVHVDRFGEAQSCQLCHGPVETMTKVRQQESLSMGWCLDCHRQPENNGPTSCSACHN